MNGKLNISLQIENEETGEIIRSSRVNIYMDTLDGCSMDYIKNCLISACNDTADIVKSI